MSNSGILNELMFCISVSDVGLSGIYTPCWNMEELQCLMFVDASTKIILGYAFTIC